MRLQAFMKQNAKQVDNEKVLVSERFLDEDGKVIPFEIRTISNEEDEAIRKKCTKTVPVLGKKGRYEKELDYSLYAEYQASTCVVFPDLKDVELQNSYGVMGESKLLKAMLTLGEYTHLLKEVARINGFDKEMDDLVDEVKN